MSFGESLFSHLFSHSFPLLLFLLTLCSLGLIGLLFSSNAKKKAFECPVTNTQAEEEQKRET